MCGFFANIVGHRTQEATSLWKVASLWRNTGPRKSGWSLESFLMTRSFLLTKEVVKNFPD